MESSYLMITTTVSSKQDAAMLAQELVGKRIVACAQIEGPITSFYWWQDMLEQEEEWRCVFKTAAALYERAEELILKVHPYEKPQIVAFPIVRGSAAYLWWITEEVWTRES